MAEGAWIWSRRLFASKKENDKGERESSGLGRRNPHRFAFGEETFACEAALLQFSILGVVKQRDDRKYLSRFVDAVNRNKWSSRDNHLVEIPPSMIDAQTRECHERFPKNRRTRLKVCSATRLPNFSTP
jgi:hypothetical protein